MCDSNLKGKKILYIVNCPAFFISHRRELAREAKKKGAIVSVATPEKKGADEISKEFKYYDLNISRNRINIFRELGTLYLTIKLLKRLQPDLAHLVTLKSILHGGLAARITRTENIVFAATGLGIVFTSKKIYTRILSYILTFFLKLAMNVRNPVSIFQNPDDRLLFINKRLVKEVNTKIIKGSGVDIAKFKAEDRNESGVIVVLLASRMLWSKGVGDYVAAVRTIEDVGKKYRFLIAGGIDTENPDSIPVAIIKKWVAEQGLEWLGHVTDMNKLLKATDIFCLPTTYGEGVPKSLIEAAACGKPIISTNMPGCREIVIHGENGILVEPGNIGDIAKAIIYLAENAEIRKQMGKKGRDIVEAEFSSSKVIQETLSAYNELLLPGQ